MPTSLVTGGAGFIGSHVADELLEMGHSVFVMDDLSGGVIGNVNERAEFRQESVVDDTAVSKLFAEFGFDYVFHLAAYAAEGLSHFIKAFNYRNNLIGSVNLINASVNTGTVKCFVFTSSIAVYGSNQLPMTEDLVPEPEDSYGIAKLAVERELRISYDMFGLPYIVFRPHSVYGERQNLGDRYRNVIGIFMNQAMRGLPFTVFGSGEQSRAFSHIADVTPAIARSIERTQHLGQTFNIGADTPCSILDLASAVAQAMGVDLTIRHLPARFEVELAYADHTKARHAFGDLMPGVGLEDGLRRMASWAIGAVPIKPAASVDITARVHHTNASGGDPQIITTASTTVTSSTSDPLALSLGSGLAQTFTSADPRRLRVEVEVTAVSGAGSFVLDYDGSCGTSRCSNLDTPVVTVPEYGLAFAAVVVLIPVTMGGAWRRKRLVMRARAAYEPPAHSQIQRRGRSSRSGLTERRKEKRP